MLERYRVGNVEVLLSASFPDDVRADEFTNRSPQDIGLAASAVINAVLRSEAGHLVFGGHPTISPLVLTSAVHLGRKGKATIFQGRFYESLIRDEVKKLVDQGYAERESVRPTSTTPGPIRRPCEKRWWRGR